MYPTYKNLILWPVVIIFIAAILGYNIFQKKQDTKAPSVTVNGQPIQTGSGKAAPPGQNPLQKILGLIPRKNQSAPARRSLGEGGDIKTYKNAEYEFEFTYPASFGEVTVKNYDCPHGAVTVGSFNNNPNVDFGFSSRLGSTESRQAKDSQNCGEDDKVLFQTQTFDYLDNKLKLYSNDSNSAAVEVGVEQTIPTPVPNIVAYIFRNNIEAESKGEATALLRSPNPSIGVLIFRTHLLPYGEGVKLLETIIK